MSDDAPPPKPAATILLLRDGKNGLEVFMVVRNHQIDFASGALVFPGGKADEQDFDEALIPFLTGHDANRDMRAAQVSAIREAFEECGILLATDMRNQQMVSQIRLTELQSCREPLNKGELTLQEFLEGNDLALCCESLTHFAHWITPPMMPKRFDTHFYVARAPEDQLATHDGYESVDSVWIKPKDAIDQEKEGKRTIIFPTLRNIERLGEAASVADAISRAEQQDVIPVLPWTEKREDGNYLCIPPEAGYAISEEKMPDRQSK